MQRIIFFLPGGMEVLLMILLLIGTSAVAGAGPVGMITRLEGDVIYQSPGEEPLPAESFMKIRPKDRFILPPDATLQIVYFETGTKETWQGPVTFEAGTAGGKGDGDKAPAVTTLPENVAKEVKRVSLLVDISRLQKTGSTYVRGVSKGSEGKELPPSLPLRESEKKEIEMARMRYEQMLKTADPGDITPEIYLFSVMADYDQFGRMKELVELMKKKQPDNEQIDLISGWMEQQM